MTIVELLDIIEDVTGERPWNVDVANSMVGIELHGTRRLDLCVYLKDWDSIHRFNDLYHRCGLLPYQIHLSITKDYLRYYAHYMIELDTVIRGM